MDPEGTGMITWGRFKDWFGDSDWADCKPLVFEEVPQEFLLHRAAVA
jgi:hypothetical protein